MTVLKCKKRRGVSEVISTVLLLAITMVGAVFVSTIIQNSMLSTTDQTQKNEVMINSIKLVGYDTRDYYELSGILTLDNKADQLLCTISCDANKDNIPTGLLGQGTDFIVLQIRNKNINPVYLQSIQINNVDHYWDGNTSGKLFDASIDDFTGKYPLSGKFSVLPGTNQVPPIQRTSVIINNDEEVRILVKLSSDISNDIDIWRPMKVNLNFGTSEPLEYIILSGDTR